MGDGPHVEVVGEHEVLVEAELPAQEIRDHPPRQGGGFVRVDGGKEHVREHHRIELRHQRSVGDHVFLQEVC